MHLRALSILALPLLTVGTASCSAAPAPTEEVGDASEALFDTSGGGSSIIVINRPRPTVSITEVTHLQPGWARARVTWNLDIPTPYVSMFPTCSREGATASLSIKPLTVSRANRTAVVDIKVDASWLIDHNDAEPCRATSFTALVGGTGFSTGSSTRTLDFAMDTPIAHRAPHQLIGLAITDTALPLVVPASSRKWAAYPPRQFVVRTAAGAISFLEVELLPARGTLGVRGVRTWDGLSRGLDFNGGAEVYPDWGIDVERRGITKAMSGVEISHPGYPSFTTGAWNTSMLSDPSKKVLAAPPLFSEAEYLANVLDNHGVPQDLGGAYRMDVVYDASTSTLRAVNGATMAALDLGPPILAAPTVSGPSVTVPSPPGFLLADTTPPATGAAPAPSCAVSGKTVTAHLSACNGASTKSGFRCPTPADPIKPETMSTTVHAGEMSQYRNISPMLASRANVLFGDCGTQAYIQAYETVLNKYVDDLAPRRTFTVNGLPVDVRDAPIGLSTAGNHWARQTWMGTQLDADNGGAVGWMPDPDGLDRPQFLDGYWTGREMYWWDWQGGLAAYDAKRGAQCGAGSWVSGFCMALGNPTPGAYRNYSNIVATRGLDPLRDGVWSLGNAPSAMVRTAIQTWPPTDRPKALRDTLAYVEAGLPVRMTFRVGAQSVTDSTGASYAVGNGVGWNLPPELAGCDPSTLWNLLLPDGHHYANIVGYSLAGSLTAPDPVNSYFIIQNNWGTLAGREGFFTMSFAYFSFIAEELHVLQLDKTCASLACARQ